MLSRDDKAVMQTSVSQTTPPSSPQKNQFIIQKDQKDFNNNYNPEIGFTFNCTRLNEKSKEKGFAGDNSDKWFDQRELKELSIAPMHHNPDSTLTHPTDIKAAVENPEEFWDYTNDFTKNQAKPTSDPYFDSYSHYYIHEEMLKDSVRTQSYHKAISQNSTFFKDKIVIDIGAGTGILSIFAAKAGAKHVYAIEFAEVALYAREIVRKAGLSDKITVVKGKVEDLIKRDNQNIKTTNQTNNPMANVEADIIVSEWMGYCLLYESMLDTVLKARDRWLRPGGKMVPDKFEMMVAGACDSQNLKLEKERFWGNVYGIDMSCLGKNFYVEPLVDPIHPQYLTTDVCIFKEFDLQTCTLADCTFANQYCLQMSRTDRIDSLVVWFDVKFDLPETVVKFSTGPTDNPQYATHWKQSLFQIDGEYDLEAGDRLTGSIGVRKNKNHPRELDFKISFNATEENGTAIGEGYSQYFIMT